MPASDGVPERAAQPPAGPSRIFTCVHKNPPQNVPISLCLSGRFKPVDSHSGALLLASSFCEASRLRSLSHDDHQVADDGVANASWAWRMDGRCSLMATGFLSDLENI